MITFRNIVKVRGFYRRAAAPEGGAQKWDRGCALALALFAFPVEAQTLPSGQTVELREVLIDSVGTERWLRFRFLAPEIARETGRITYEEAAPDMDLLCNGLAVDYLKENALTADKIAISLSDRDVVFGAADPEATQFFELYSFQDGTCVWEAF
jgi:hypothetical protein